MSNTNWLDAARAKRCQAVRVPARPEPPTVQTLPDVNPHPLRPDVPAPVRVPAQPKQDDNQPYDRWLVDDEQREE